MVRFYGFCDGKIMVRKTRFLCENVYFFRKIFGARYLIGINCLLIGNYV